MQDKHEVKDTVKIEPFAKEAHKTLPDRNRDSKMATYRQRGRLQKEKYEVWEK